MTSEETEKCWRYAGIILEIEQIAVLSIRKWTYSVVDTLGEYAVASCFHRYHGMSVYMCVYACRQRSMSNAFLNQSQFHILSQGLYQT